MRETLISAAVLAALAAALGPSAASAETVATGCVLSNGNVNRVRPFSGTPTTPCPGQTQVLSFQAEVPGVRLLTGNRVLNAPGETALVSAPPFSLVLTLAEDGTCQLELEAVPAALPLLVPGTDGSTQVTEELTLLLTAAPDDIAGDLTDQEYISLGRASFLISDIQLTNNAGENCRGGAKARVSRPHFQRFTR
jgi:hypothetical protein